MNREFFIINANAGLKSLSVSGLSSSDMAKAKELSPESMNEDTRTVTFTDALSSSITMGGGDNPRVKIFLPEGKFITLPDVASMTFDFNNLSEACDIWHTVTQDQIHPTMPMMTLESESLEYSDLDNNKYRVNDVCRAIGKQDGTILHLTGVENPYLPKSINITRNDMILTSTFMEDIKVM